ncbi:ParB-like chromosome segregation protein Spo0J [Nocardia tenerifensis]|uniref:ParB-like chromosome segregation protein Spo0J n=1 Tax=Nocardia tenerifensis TaxID=228006 RepID=A0A318KB05_9NOCA|nr:ParB N-terminal domain-containing protein [Nocardia tenerifensis]PXX71721.1 ParB-like chromosome segregation protein Spo0J [Nocardia tenerifensis]
MTGISPSVPEVVHIPLRDLAPPDSPRFGGTDPGHARVLAESAAPLPPILVSRCSMRIIDGAHRVLAARLCGYETIAAVYFEGDECDAFMLAVKLNVAQGLPLTVAERKAAALRILRAHPRWSDRAVAAVVGLSDKTVGAVRRRAAAEIPQSTDRVARNGVVHRLDTARGRLRAVELLSADPGATVRAVAHAADISEATVKDARRRLRQGVDPVPDRLRTASADEQVPAKEPATRRYDAVPAMLQRLRRDPSVARTESGRHLLRWLDMPGFDPANRQAAVRNLPDYHVGAVVELARQRAQALLEFARVLEGRGVANRADPPAE